VIKIAMDGTTGWFGPTILDKYGTPHLSELKACGAQPIETPPNHLATLVLNSIFVRGDFPDPQRRIVFMFGRRVLEAVDQYIRGREVLLSYVKKLPMTNGHFLEATTATTYFEHCVASACQAIALFNRLIELAKQPKLDDDRAERLRKIWNRSKHFDEDLMGDARSTSNIVAPVWLTNVDISSTIASVTFDELHSLLRELLGILQTVSNCK
jgi:hypothetical protein